MTVIEGHIPQELAARCFAKVALGRGSVTSRKTACPPPEAACAPSGYSSVGLSRRVAQRWRPSSLSSQRFSGSPVAVSPCNHWTP